jgi:hypothetical protein
MLPGRPSKKAHTCQREEEHQYQGGRDQYLGLRWLQEVATKSRELLDLIHPASSSSSEMRVAPTIVVPSTIAKRQRVEDMEVAEAEDHVEKVSQVDEAETSPFKSDSEVEIGSRMGEACEVEEHATRDAELHNDTQALSMLATGSVNVGTPH